MQRPFPAYDGDEPFIFVSYAHSDSRIVYAELARLREAGFRIWYDEGINPGSRWTDDLADRISNASLVLFFATPNSAASENCRNEIDFALEQQRNVLLVYLKPTDLPGGMKLALSGRQAILKHEHSTAAYQDKLLKALEEQVHGEVRERIDTSRPRRLAKMTIAAMAVLGIIGGVVGSYLVEPSTPGQQVARTAPLPVLIADFLNETDQPVFNGVLEEALKVGMEGAPFITSFPRENATRVLTQLKEETELTHESARLVAVREDVDLVLAGFVRGTGAGYELEVQGLDPLSGDIRFSATEEAASPLDALTGIANLAKTLRRRLGDVSVETSHLEEVFTSSSMLAVSEFAKAQALATAWRHAEAVEHYAKAVELDPEFGRAYGGWAYSAYALGQLEESQALWEKSLARLGSMTERERLRTLGIYYMTVSGNTEKAIETYTELISKYPADASAYSNLAVALFNNLQLAEARAAGGRILEIYPSSLLYLGNYALYNMYVADSEQAVDYANRTLEKEAGYYVAHLPIASAALLDLDYEAAEAAYASMAATGTQGLSLADLGRADMALARGNYARAIELLEESVPNDELAKNVQGANTKRLWLARALIGSGREEDAGAVLVLLGAAQLSDRQELELAELLLRRGDAEGAIAAADRLAAKVPASSRALAYLIRGMVALEADDHQQAIQHLNRSVDLRDNWLARLQLGRAYLGVDVHVVEALDELDGAWDRRGEGMAAFLDDTPTYQRLVEVHYWLGRAQESLGMSSDAAGSYRRYTLRRDLAIGDPLVVDATARLDALVSTAAD